MNYPWVTAQNVVGQVAYDYIDFGGNCTMNQSFLVAASFDESGFKDYGIDGYCGLGVSNSTIYPHFIDNLYNHGMITSRSFSLDIQLKPYNASDAEFSNDQNSYLILGGYEEQYMITNFTNVSVVNTGNWTINLTSLSIDDTPVQITSNLAILASGSQNLLMPPNDYTAFIEALQLAWNVTLDDSNSFPCPMSDSRLPSIVFGFDDQTLEFEIEYLLNSSYSGCSLMVAPEEYLNNTWVLGSPFLANYYVLFDLDNMTIGFANSVNSDEPENTLVLIAVLTIPFVLVLIVVGVICMYKKIKVARKSRKISEAIAKSQLEASPKRLLEASPKRQSEGSLKYHHSEASQKRPSFTIIRVDSYQKLTDYQKLADG